MAARALLPLAAMRELTRRPRVRPSPFTARSGRAAVALVACTTGATIAGGGCGVDADAEGTTVSSEVACDLGEMLDAYARYVTPLTSSPESQSCTYCHAGNDLTKMERQTPCHTMACMIEQQLVDLSDPEASHVLEITQMGAKFQAPIDPAVMQREHDGLLAWIEYGAQCFAQACGTLTDPCGTQGTSGAGGATSGAGGSVGSGSGGSVGTGGGASWGKCTEEDVLGIFTQKVWAHIGNKTADATDGDGNPGNNGMCWACHGKGGKESAKTVKQMGELWNDDVDPKKTLYNMAATTTMLNAADPTKSELVTKPIGRSMDPQTTVAPSKLGSFYAVKHGGGQKLDPTKPAFTDFVDFLAYYAACMAP
jgi:hypothetical protein